ncbi:MAG: hypothetical protein WAN18_18285, partial [Candidatus Sulfotelmatobacter sp.]
YCDHVEGDGESLFQLACDGDLEGIVAKRKFDPYIEKQARWLKVRNTSVFAMGRARRPFRTGARNRS